MSKNKVDEASIGTLKLQGLLKKEIDVTTCIEAKR